MAEITPYIEDLKGERIPSMDSLANSNILVTGATGLIGSALIDLLMVYADEYDYKVYAGCRSREKFEKRFPVNKHLQYFCLDVTQTIESEQHFDYIIHGAGWAAPNAFATDPVGVMKANILGTTNLLDYGISHGLKRFLYISSGEVYGEGCPGKWTETDSGYVNSMSARACYPSAKRAAETLCTAYTKQYGIDSVVARLSHSYGPYFTPSDNRVYAQFIRNVLQGEDIILKSRGDQYRSWLYVVDSVAALLYILVEGKSGEAYNVANNGANITIRQLAETIAGIANKKVIFGLPTDTEKLAATPITKAIFDTSKLEALGWQPQFDITTGLNHTIKTLLCKTER